MQDADAELFEPKAIEFAAGPDEIIEAKNLGAGQALPESRGNRAAHKTADAADEDFQIRKEVEYSESRWPLGASWIISWICEN